MSKWPVFGVVYWQNSLGSKGLNSTLESVVTNEVREVVGRNNQEHCVGSCNHYHHVVGQS